MPDRNREFLCSVGGSLVIPERLRMQSTARTWALAEFDSSRLGDSRLVRRAITVGAALACQPSGVISRAVKDPAEREAAYQFLENTRVTATPIAKSVFSATAARARALPFVFVAVDASSLAIGDEEGDRGTGPIGTKDRGGRGFLMMSALAVASDGTPLGLCAQEWWTRGEETVTPAGKDRRKVAGKETKHWLAAVRKTRSALKGTNCRPWFQLDRGGDAWPVLLDAVDSKSWLTVRACHSRRLRRQRGGEQEYLWPTVDAAAPLGRYSVAVAAGPGREARTAVMVVRACEVTLDIQKLPQKAHVPVRVWAVHASEAEASAGAATPLQWRLLTTHPATTFVDACTVLFGYTQRWRVEEFHKALKTGACNIEDTQLRSGRGILVLATLLSAVATRLLRMTYLSRRQPDLPASVEFSLPELHAAAALTGRRKPRSAEAIPLATAVLWVAEAGGYTGGGPSRPPGLIVLARGLSRVLLVVASREPPKKDRRRSNIPRRGQA